MEFRILGPLEVLDDGRRLPLAGSRQRALLAVLILHANEVVSIDRLVDEIWNEQPPATAAKALHVYVSQLRKTLGDRAKDDEGVLVTRSPGYVLSVASDELDAARFERLVEDGRSALASGKPEEAVRSLLAGLALWRGPALADFTHEPFARSEIARLDEARLSAVEDRIDADLELDRHKELIPELTSLIGTQPLRERLRGQLMLALYRSGRQAEALGAYQDARRLLDEELGLEPGPELQRLERAILVQDPALEPPGHPGRRAQARRTLRGPPLALLVAAGAVLVAGVIATVELARGSPRVAVPLNSLAVLDAKSGRVEASVPVGARPTDVTSGGGRIWAANFDEQTLSKIDPRNKKELARVPAGGAPTGIAAAGDAVWVSHGFASTVTRIDPGIDKISATLPAGSGIGQVVAGRGAVWLADRIDGTVQRIDPTTNERITSVVVGGSPSALALGAGFLWVADGRDVVRVDATTSRVLTRIALRHEAGRIAVGAGAVWVTNTLADTVSRIDPATEAAAIEIPVGDGPVGITASPDAVWVANSLDGTVTKIDPTTNQVVKTITLGGSPQGVAVSGRSVWVTVAAP